MRNTAAERIRSLLQQALSDSRRANFSTLTYLIKICLRELNELCEAHVLSKQEANPRPTIISEDRPPEVIGIWEWDVVNKMVYADSDVAKICNLDPETAKAGVPQKRFAAAIYPEDRTRISDAVTHSLSEGGGFNAVIRLVQANGSLKTVFAIGKVIFKESQPVSFKGTVIDVTEDEVRKSRAMKFSAIRAVPSNRKI